MRLEVFASRGRLAHGLHALAGSAMGNCPYTLEHLEDFLNLVLPLLGSPLVSLASESRMGTLSACSGLYYKQVFFLADWLSTRVG